MYVVGVFTSRLQVVHLPLTLICMMMFYLTFDLSPVSPLWLLLTVQV